MQMNKTTFKKTFLSAQYGMIYAEVIKHGRIIRQKDLTTGRDTPESMAHRWIDAVHLGMQVQFYLKGGIIEWVKVSTNSNLFKV